MLTSEKIRVGLFVGAVWAVYTAAAWQIAARVFRRLGASPRPESCRWTIFRRVVLGLAALGLLCLAYGFFVEPNWLAVTHVRIESRKISDSGRPVRIVHVSDIHSNLKPRLEERLPEVIAAEKPDLIVYTGDSVNSPEGLPVFQLCLRRLAALAPTFAVRGNWDVDEWSSLDLFGGTGARELNDDGVAVEIRGTKLWVAGAPMRSEEPANKVLSTLPAQEFTIFLHHSPDFIESAAQAKVDLYCAGHTHGGQVALPFYGALVTFSKFGKRYEAGLYRVGPTWLYVNRGIGMTAGHAPPVRFCARPEVTVIDLVSAR